jgi:hypothetical protein
MASKRAKFRVGQRVAFRRAKAIPTRVTRRELQDSGWMYYLKDFYGRWSEWELRPLTVRERGGRKTR